MNSDFMGISSSMSIIALVPITLSNSLGGNPVPGLLISTISRVMIVSLGIFTLETILLLAYFSPSDSQSNSILCFSPLESSASRNPSTKLENPETSKDNR